MEKNIILENQHEIKVIRIVNLDPNITENVLREFLKQTLDHRTDEFIHRLHINYDAKLDKTFAYVVFESYKHAERALQKLDGFNYNNTFILQVNIIAPHLEYKEYSHDSPSAVKFMRYNMRAKSSSRETKVKDVCSANNNPIEKMNL